MYTPSTKRSDPAYQLRVKFDLTFPDGIVWETYHIRRARSATLLSVKEFRAISHVWLDDFLAATKQQYPDARLRVLQISTETNVLAEK